MLIALNKPCGSNFKSLNVLHSYSRHFEVLVSQSNNYPDWMLTIPNTGSASRDSKESVNEKKIYNSVPSIKGTSESLQSEFKSHKVTLAHKPFNLKEQCHKDFAVLGQFCSKIITLRL